MDVRLGRADRELQERARAFTDEVLAPLEDECEAHDGLLPESAAAAHSAVVEWGFNAINHAPEAGGQGYDLFQQMLIDVGRTRSVHGLVTEPPDRKPLSAIKLLRDDPAAVVDKVEEIKANYAKYFGT